MVMTLVMSVVVVVMVVIPGLSGSPAVMVVVVSAAVVASGVADGACGADDRGRRDWMWPVAPGLGGTPHTLPQHCRLVSFLREPEIRKVAVTGTGCVG